MALLGASHPPAPGGEQPCDSTTRHRLAGRLRSPALMVGVLAPDLARADPATPVSYPTASSATRVQGRFFDTCTAPSLAALAAWRGTSPYTGANIYFGGRNRGCAQPNLTAAWVRSASAAGWSLIPT